MIRIGSVPDLECDVVVVGAGPAGAAAAAHMARLGLTVSLFDRQRFPRDKVCGDFVSPVALLELKELELTSRSAYRFSNIIRSAALHLDGEQLISTRLPHVSGLPSNGRVIPRKVLDNLILNAARDAGAQVLENVRLTGFETDAYGVTASVQVPGGIRKIRAKLLVGADGSASLVARQLRGRVRQEDRIIAVRAYYENVRGPSDRADMYFASESFPGYYWLFPTGAHRANVGVGMVLDTLPPTRDQLSELLKKLVHTDPALRDRLRGSTQVGKIVGWPLTTYNPRLPIVGKRIMLVGDAAGLINSLNGEGIQYALLSGRWAAEVACRCVVADDFSDEQLGRYSDIVEHELRYDMALARLIVQLIRNRALNPIWLQALKIIVRRARADPEYARLTGGILVGSLPAHSVLSLKVVVGTVEQAAMSVGMEAALALLRGPRALLSAIADSSEVGIRAGNDLLRRPLSYGRWGLSLAAGTAELGWQFAKATARSAGPNRTPENNLRISLAK